MKLSDFFEKYVRVFTCNDLIIIGDVIDYYPAISTESGEDEIDIFPDGINHIIRVKESEIVAIEEISQIQTHSTHWDYGHGMSSQNCVMVALIRNIQ